MGCQASCRLLHRPEREPSGPVFRTRAVSVPSSRIIKAGALLEDTRRLLEVWDPSLDERSNLARIRVSGMLGKTRTRSEDILRILRQRYVDPGKHVLTTLRRLLDDPKAFREACYYEAARSDALLGLFAEEPLYEWFVAGRPYVVVGEVSAWLLSDARFRGWGPSTRERVAQGLLATLRDFGILEGSRRGVRKRLAASRLSIPGFAYVAFRERERGLTGPALVESRVWRRYLLTASGVRHLFLEADRLRLLRYLEAGSAVRVDWSIRKLEEVADVLAT